MIFNTDWSDCKSKSTPDHWGDDGTMVAGWNHGGDDITEGLQWDGTSETGWNIVVSKGKVCFKSETLTHCNVNVGDNKQYIITKISNR